MPIELTAGLSVDEYLDRSFDPKCELLGGETRPKPLGTGKHSKMQRRLLRLLEAEFGEGRVEFELSVRIGDEVPVPDLVVLKTHNPPMYRDVLDEPPLLCIEVVSPSQLPAEMLAKCARYHDFGVPFCWVVDPVTRRAWECHRGVEPREVTETLSGPCILALSDVFAA
jgi:Uma2 family endonuclease